jgi:transcriptional regulator with XRE-family HTH domain
MAFIACQYPNFTFRNRGGIMELDRTPGERLDFLLRRQGNLDKREKYSQYDLTDFLTGAKVAPNGQRYSIQTSRSTVNRYVTGHQEMPYDVITAICEIFGVSADWLLRGRGVEEDEGADIFLTPEAGEVAAMIDEMTPENRGVVAVLARELLATSQRQRETEIQLAQSLQEQISAVTAGRTARNGGTDKKRYRQMALA